MRLTRRNFLFLSGLNSLSFLHKDRTLNNLSSSFSKKHLIKAYRDGWIELNLDNMGWNLNKIRERVKVPVMGVIKANAYGHGLVEVGSYLDAQGIDGLMVCKLQEAVMLREAGVECPVHNFGPFCSKDSESLLHFDISQSVFSDEIMGLDEFAQKHRVMAKVHIHVDTGMGRMGIAYDQALPYLEKTASLGGIEIKGISTTLTEIDFYGEQMKRFLHLCQEAATRGVRLGRRHAASSSAIFISPSTYLDMVRPGITLYGFFPSGSSRHKDGHILKPVLSFKSRVATVKILKSGSTIGYTRDFTAKKRERIAVIPVGSTDGYPYNVKKKASVLIKGHRFPVISTVTFNHVEVLLDSNTPIIPGDEVVLIGSQGKDKITADEVASWADISTYKVLAFLNPLLPRYTKSQSS